MYSGDVMLKFYFSIKTRDGQRVESILIQGKDLPDAERKLRQMYHNCEVVNCKTLFSEKTAGQSVDIEDVLTIISKQS